MQNLCFHGAKATNISIFWYPQSCQAVMLMLTSHSSYVTPALSSMIWAGPRGQYPAFSLVGMSDYVSPKNVILAPAYQNVTI